MEQEERPMENGTLVTPEADDTTTPLNWNTVEADVWSAFPDDDDDVVVISQENHMAEPHGGRSVEDAAVSLKRPRIDPPSQQQSIPSANLQHSAQLPRTTPLSRPMHPPHPIHPPSISSLPPLPSSSQLGAHSGLLFNTPYYVTPFPPPNFVPTWKQLLPPEASNMGHALSRLPPVQKIYRLSLLNVQEFTIQGLSPRHDLPPTPIHGLRVPIRQISRHHGKALYQSGKWRIPLAAYHDFAGYLQNDGATVYGIPPNQLQIASLERARQEKGYPTPDQLVEYGVPVGLAQALAPFQRGGVDFVREKQGRALIADGTSGTWGIFVRSSFVSPLDSPLYFFSAMTDMGLGKTIQGVASMSMFWQEWPLLVLCPSGARYHWENEFQQWLGRDSRINQSEHSEEGNNDGDAADHTRSSQSQGENGGPLLRDEQIHVLTSAKSPIFPRDDTKVVICSYGLSSVLIESGKMVRRQFRCAIVDESHMLKNKSTKRTSLLLPILNATDRCVLLSGTPALAKPLELWPQLAILGTEQHGWGAGTESEFMEKYVKNGSSQRSAELHTMLRGTVMIRRLKNDILKTLPRKVREKAEVHVLANEVQRTEFKNLLTLLRDSKGALGNLARIHQAELEHSAAPQGVEQRTVTEPLSNHEEETDSVRITQQLQSEKAHATAQLNADVKQQWATGQSQIRQTMDQQLFHLHGDDRRNAVLQMEGHLRNNLRLYADEKMRDIDSSYAQQLEQVKEKEELKRTSLLSRLYSLTGDVKIPLIVDSLKRWLADPTKGKVCVFAHHLSVLDAIRNGVGLSNDDGEDRKRFIRIDGSTLPKTRQEQITAFQTDLSIRVALLGITAAGVAVTLTASSTVWFAELFWTPAIMIQAEG
jgi:SNF2 family DNA or RNA helicase